MLVEDLRTRTFASKIKNFSEESYSLDKHSHLSKLLNVLLGSTGIGHLSRVQLLARLSESVPGTRFNDLDVLFGEFLGFPRLKEEQYVYNPFVDSLTSSQWKEVESKDGSYRERISKFMRAVNLGSTLQALELAAESVVGKSCSIYERWRDLDGIDTTGLTWDMPSNTNPYKQFIILVSGSVSPYRKRILFSVIRRLKPVDTTFQLVVSEDEYNIAQTVNYATSSSEFSFLERKIYPFETGIETSFVSSSTTAFVPVTAFMFSQESEVLLNNSVVRSSLPLNYQKRIVEPTWGEWQVIPLANSSDNYPTGKYGDGKFSWESQAQWEIVFTQQVEGLGGEVVAGRYRIPVVSTIQSKSNVLYDVTLSKSTSVVRSSWYGGV